MCLCCVVKGRDYLDLELCEERKTDGEPITNFESSLIPSDSLIIVFGAHDRPK